MAEQISPEPGRSDQEREFQKFVQETMDYAADVRAKAALATDKFAYAVKYSKAVISEGLSNPHLNDFSDEALERIGMLGVGEQSDLQSRVLEQLVRNDDNSEQFRKILKLAIARVLEEKIELPSSVNEWLQKYLRHELPDTLGIKGRPKKQGFEDLIFQTVQDLVDYHGLNATRNDTGSPTSASDAVAEALCQLKQSPRSYYRVRRIWQSKPGYRFPFQG